MANYVKFSIIEEKIVVPYCWAGIFASLRKIPNIVSTLPENIAANQFHLSKPPNEYEYYLRVDYNENILRQAIQKFNGPIINCDPHAQFGFYMDDVLSHARTKHAIYDGKNYTYTNNKQVYIDQFNLALQAVVKEHRLQHQFFKPFSSQPCEMEEKKVKHLFPFKK